jgi:probable F420-dependent oxidoreductase
VGIEFALKLPIHGQKADTPFAPLLDLAVAAEEAGFSSVYVIDHLLLPPPRLLGFTDADPDKPYFTDAWTSLAAIAARTSRIRIGPQVTPIGLRHPVFIAKWGATIDRISDGRFRLGVGLGHQEVEYVSHGFPYPPFKERYERMTEGVEIIRRLWSDEPSVTYEGKHYTVTDVNFWPKPVQASVPIWFGGTSASIRRGVAAMGDGWFPAAPQLGGFGPEFFRESLAEIRASAAGQGRTQRIGAGALFQGMISEDRADIDRSVALLHRRPEYEGLSLEEIRGKGVIMIGTPDDVCRQIEPYAEAGVEEFSFLFHPLDDLDGVRRAIDLYAKKVMPQFA